jgi:hypothetical protein
MLEERFVDAAEQLEWQDGDKLVGIVQDQKSRPKANEFEKLTLCAHRFPPASFDKLWMPLRQAPRQAPGAPQDAAAIRQRWGHPHQSGDPHDSCSRLDSRFPPRARGQVRE